ncbi:membrane protein insertase YidC [Hathewaya histolytica]|uniref:Membrane protein insertase, YidC/Oxa1 family n=1 Tax=Hathewaya histolytica TaxID=1498 RepID=A0A4V6KF40_HATHI|nr:membrane protein insertase YidC [Hathewaya histolytica]VTQ96647.1 membrane protein insertase, YidC/Oxa1 family [Hathewaya histolytica]
MNFLIQPIARVFEVIHKYISGGVSDVGLSYGLTIIAVTFLIKLLLLPLNIKSTKSMMKSSEVQSEVKKIQQKYKADPQRANQEVMKFYKENGINPMAGCLPLLIQMPILIALYGVFNNLSGIQGVSFLWLKDLASPDKTYILPILAGVSQFVVGKLTPTSSTGDSAQQAQMKTMNVVMPAMIAFMTLPLKSALGLYWVVSNIIQGLQSLLVYFLIKREKESK